MQHAKVENARVQNGVERERAPNRQRQRHNVHRPLLFLEYVTGDRVHMALYTAPRVLVRHPAGKRRFPSSMMTVIWCTAFVLRAIPQGPPIMRAD